MGELVVGYALLVPPSPYLCLEQLAWQFGQGKYHALRESDCVGREVVVGYWVHLRHHPDEVLKVDPAWEHPQLVGLIG
jgi:hypothetical protein